MNARLFILSSALLLFAWPDCLAQQITHEELLEVLGVKSWRIPLPQDKSLEWSIEIVDYTPRKFVKAKVDWLNRRQKALVILRDVGKDAYQFTLKQRAGTGQGTLEINICSEKEKSENNCDNSYSLGWHDVPQPFGDGMRFVLADISPMLEPDKPRKQIILVPTHFRLEDIMKEKKSPQ